MIYNHSPAEKGQFDAVVCSNKQIGGRFYRLGLEFSEAGAKVFTNFRPGQFVQLDISGTAMPKNELIAKDLLDVSKRKILLRRPFSLCDVTGGKDKTTVEILYCVVGPATLRMTTLRAGDSISVIGPLGNGFWVPQDKKTALLIAGGTGAPPMQHLAKNLTSDYPDIKVTAFVGAKSKKELPFKTRIDDVSKEIEFPIAEFAKYGIESYIATDDGSAGFGGLVTDCFYQWLDKHPPETQDTIIYSCGPEAMLAKVAEIANKKNIDCQVSMERRMACGIGICQSCAIECKVPESYETIYKLCCKDGPVFDAREVAFSL